MRGVEKYIILSILGQFSKKNLLDKILFFISALKKVYRSRSKVVKARGKKNYLFQLDHPHANTCDTESRHAYEENIEQV